LKPAASPLSRRRTVRADGPGQDSSPPPARSAGMPRAARGAATPAAEGARVVAADVDRQAPSDPSAQDTRKSRWTLKKVEQRPAPVSPPMDDAELQRIQKLCSQRVTLDMASGWLHVKLGRCGLKDSQVVALSRHLEAILPAPRQSVGEAPLVYAWLELDSNAMSDTGFEAVLDVCVRHRVYFKVLKLYKNRLTDRAGARLAALIRRQTSPIEEMHLSHNRMTERTVVAIGAAAMANRAYPRTDDDGFGVPCWIRLEHNLVERGDHIVRLLRNEGLHICLAEDRKNCGAQGCVHSGRGRGVAKVHLFALHTQRRRESAGEDAAGRPPPLDDDGVRAEIRRWKQLPVREVAQPKQQVPSSQPATGGGEAGGAATAPRKTEPQWRPKERLEPKAPKALKPIKEGNEPRGPAARKEPKEVEETKETKDTKDSKQAYDSKAPAEKKGAAERQQHHREDEQRPPAESTEGLRPQEGDAPATDAPAVATATAAAEPLDPGTETSCQPCSYKRSVLLSLRDPALKKVLTPAFSEKVLRLAPASPTLRAREPEVEPEAGDLRPPTPMTDASAREPQPQHRRGWRHPPPPPATPPHGIATLTSQFPPPTPPTGLTPRSGAGPWLKRTEQEQSCPPPPTSAPITPQGSVASCWLSEGSQEEQSRRAQRQRFRQQLQHQLEEQLRQQMQKQEEEDEQQRDAEEHPEKPQPKKPQDKKRRPPPHTSARDGSWLSVSAAGTPARVISPVCVTPWAPPAAPQHQWVSPAWVARRSATQPAMRGSGTLRAPPPRLAPGYWGPPSMFPGYCTPPHWAAQGAGRGPYAMRPPTSRASQPHSAWAAVAPERRTAPAPTAATESAGAGPQDTQQAEELSAALVRICSACSSSSSSSSDAGGEGTQPHVQTNGVADSRAVRSRSPPPRTPPPSPVPGNEDAETEHSEAKPSDDYAPLWAAIETVKSVGWSRVQWKRNYTALHLAAHLGRADTVPLLLSLRADPSAPDHKGRTALDVARAGGRDDVAEALSKSMAAPGGA